MKKTKSLNLLLVFIVFFSVIFMSIGYSALNRNLTISGEAIVYLPPGIRVTNVSLKEATNGGYETYSSSVTGYSSNMFVTLPNANSTVTLIIEVTNNDDIYYHLNSITEIDSSNSDIGYEIVDKEAQYFLENSVTELEIKFFHKNATVTSTDLALNLSYDFTEVHYRKLDYIISDGTQWMYTGLMNTGNYIFEDEFLITDIGEGNNTGSWIIGGRANPSYTLGVFVNNTQVIAAYGTISQNMTPKILENQWYEMYFSMERLTIGGTNYNLTGEKEIPEAYIAELILGGNLLAFDGVSVDDRNMQGYRKYFKVTNGDTGELLRYYVPVKINNTNEIGYWDEVNNVFRRSDGIEEYIAP